MKVKVYTAPFLAAKLYKLPWLNVLIFFNAVMLTGVTLCCNSIVQLPPAIETIFTAASFPLVQSISITKPPLAHNPFMLPFFQAVGYAGNSCINLNDFASAFRQCRRWRQNFHQSEKGGWVSNKLFIVDVFNSSWYIL